MLKWRLFFGAILIALLGAIFTLDGYFAGLPDPDTVSGTLLRDGFVLALFAAVLAAAGAFEFAQLVREAGYRPFSRLMVLAAMALAVIPVFSLQLQAYALDTAAVAAIILCFAFDAQIARRETQRAVANVGVTIFGILYVGLLLSYIVKVRTDFGPLAVVVMVAAVKSGDMGAFFTGKAFGRHKLAPWLSPGKTIEGLIGALAASTIVTVICARAFAIPNLDWPAAAAIGLLLGLVGHFGDLIESLIKRDCGAKDSARMLPAFGGVLDLVDSVLPAGLIWYIILSNIQASTG